MNNRLKFRAFWSRLIGVALVVFGLFLASASAAPLIASTASAAEALCDEPCADHAQDERCDDDLCPDDCPDCTHCHSVAPMLVTRVSPLNITALPHSRDALPYASIAPSGVGQRLFKPPRRA